MKSLEQALKFQLLDYFEQGGAHLGLEKALCDLPLKCYGESVEGAPYTIWQLLEHIRIAQVDILEYIRNPAYESPAWPDGYWPKEKAPRSKSELNSSLKKYRQDFGDIANLLKSPQTKLLAPIPHIQKGPLILKEILLILDHCSYHVGQIILLRRLLGAWKEA